MCCFPQLEVERVATSSSCFTSSSSFAASTETMPSAVSSEMSNFTLQSCWPLFAASVPFTATGVAKVISLKKLPMFRMFG